MLFSPENLQISVINRNRSFICTLNHMGPKMDPCGTHGITDMYIK